MVLGVEIPQAFLDLQQAARQRLSDQEHAKDHDTEDNRDGNDDKD